MSKEDVANSNIVALLATYEATSLVCVEDII